jgi:polar amino acid transport system substrate-binding protein
MHRLAFALLAFCLLGAAGFGERASAQDQPAVLTAPTEPVLPRFRRTDLSAKPQNFTRESVTIEADEDFPPFSYAGPAGEPKGIAVEAAEAACKELGTRCDITLAPWRTLNSDLNAAGIVAGLRLDDKTMARFEPTRPIYRAIGRFAVRKDSEHTQASARSLAGKRIGVIAGSGYEAWLKRNFSESEIVAFPNMGELEEGLRAGRVEFLFGDGLQLVYWLHGEASQNCCKYLDGAYYDDQLFSRPYVFLVRRGDEELKQAFDYALDQIQETGAFSRIFTRYVPARFW